MLGLLSVGQVVALMVVCQSNVSSRRHQSIVSLTNFQEAFKAHDMHFVPFEKRIMK